MSGTDAISAHFWVPLLYIVKSPFRTCDAWRACSFQKRCASDRHSQLLGFPPHSLSGCDDTSVFLLWHSCFNITRAPLLHPRLSFLLSLSFAPFFPTLQLPFSVFSPYIYTRLCSPVHKFFRACHPPRHAGRRESVCKPSPLSARSAVADSCRRDRHCLPKPWPNRELLRYHEISTDEPPAPGRWQLVRVQAQCAVPRQSQRESTACRERVR